MSTFDKDLKENTEITNKLLLDMIQNQKESNNNLTKSFIISSICFCVIIVSMIIGFFVYESQYEVIDTATTEVSQEAETNGNGDIIMNNSGELNYGTSEAINKDN